MTQKNYVLYQMTITCYSTKNGEGPTEFLSATIDNPKILITLNEEIRKAWQDNSKYSFMGPENSTVNIDFSTVWSYVTRIDNVEYHPR